MYNCMGVDHFSFIKYVIVDVLLCVSSFYSLHFSGIGLFLAPNPTF